jgi:hypothetical protein
MPRRGHSRQATTRRQAISTLEEAGVGALRRGLFHRSHTTPTVLVGCLVDGAAVARAVPEARRVSRRSAHAGRGARRSRGRGGATPGRDRVALGACLGTGTRRASDVEHPERKTACDMQRRNVRGTPRGARPIRGRGATSVGVDDSRRHPQDDPGRAQTRVSKTRTRDSSGPGWERRIVPRRAARLRRGAASSRPAAARLARPPAVSSEIKRAK